MAEPFDNIQNTTFAQHRFEGLPEIPAEELPPLPSLREALIGQMLVVIKEDEEEQGEIWTSLVFENGYTLIIQSPWIIVHPSGQIEGSETER